MLLVTKYNSAVWKFISPTRPRGYMSSGLGFIASQVLCVCNFYATVFCNFVATVFCNCFFATFCYFFATFCCKKKLPKKVATNAQTVATNLQKVANKKLHKSCKHIEPGTQWTRHTKPDMLPAKAPTIVTWSGARFQVSGDGYLNFLRKLPRNIELYMLKKNHGHPSQIHEHGNEYSST